MKSFAYSVVIAAAVAGAASSAHAADPFAWRSPDVTDAWNAGYRGAGVNVRVVSPSLVANLAFTGNLDGVQQTLSLIDWQRKAVSLVAPDAAVSFSTAAVADPGTVAIFPSLGNLPALKSGLNVIAYSNEGMDIGMTGDVMIAAERQLNSWAKAGSAVIVQAAGPAALGTIRAGTQDYQLSGNMTIDDVASFVKAHCCAPSTPRPMGAVAGPFTLGDALAIANKNASSVIFVGALDKNGSPTAKAKLLPNSGSPGTDAAFQNRYLSVGVGRDTGLIPADLATAVVSGYAAIVGSKFKAASPTAVVSQLLKTARTDTIQDYTPAVHGKGEASLSRALAPTSIK